MRKKSETETDGKTKEWVRGFGVRAGRRGRKAEGTRTKEDYLLSLGRQ